MNNRATSSPRNNVFNLSPNWWDRRAAARTKPKPLASPSQANDLLYLIDVMYAAVGDFRVETGPPEEAREWRSMRARMSQRGFRLLGTGFFSAAFVHLSRPDIAFKFGFKKEDSGAQYAAWCRQNQGRAAVPVVHHITRRDAGYVVVMKKYTRFPSWGERTPYQERVYRDLAAVIDHGTALSEDRRVTVDEYEVARDIRSFFLGVAHFDLHSGNIMLDPDTGKVVITDPVSTTIRKAAETRPAIRGIQADMMVMDELQAELPTPNKAIDVMLKQDRARFSFMPLSHIPPELRMIQPLNLDQFMRIDHAA